MLCFVGNFKVFFLLFVNVNKNIIVICLLIHGALMLTNTTFDCIVNIVFVNVEIKID